MFLRPREKKYKKEIRGKNLGISNESISFGSFAIKSLDYGRITARQIETARRIISKKVKSTGKFWICIYPSKPVQKNRMKFEWEKVRVLFHFGLLLLDLGKFYMKLKVLIL